MQGGGGQQNSSAGLDMVYYAAAIVLGSLLVWNYFSGYIVAVVYRIAYYEGVAMIFPLNFINEELAVLFPGYRPISFFSGMDLLEAMTLMVQDFSLEEAKQVPFDEFASTLGVVGRYLLAYTAPLWVAMSVFLFTHAVDSRYKTKYTMEDFRQLESFNWPAISTMLSKNYSTTPLDDGPFAMSLQPMGFAKKYQLLTEKEVDGKTIAVVDRDKAYTLFCCQMGPAWDGSLQYMPQHVLALFAIFSAKAEHDTKSSDLLLRQISKSSLRGNTKLDYSSVNTVLSKHIRSMKIAQVVGPHAFLYPAMASLLELAREDGVLATSEFIWLKMIDRPLWYMLNSVGRRTAFPEVSGPYAHWIMEKRLRRPLKTPMVAEAINALELGVAEFIYKPTDQS